MSSTISSDLADKLVGEATFLDRHQLEKLQQERLWKIVRYARTYSPYFKEKYHALSEHPNLPEIPVSLRSELTARFDDWVTESEIKRSEVQAFVSDFANLGKKYRDRYVAMTTSGTTGDPLILLRDDQHGAVNGALMKHRYFDGPCLKNVKGLKDPLDTKACAIISNKGFHSAFLSFCRMQAQFQALGKESLLRLIPVDAPFDDMISQLNDFQPEMIACYPSALIALVPAKQAGILDISPQYIACSAEQLSDANRRLLSKTFGCPVLNNYCSSEGGEIAMSCPEGHLHVNIDWIIIEPVDDENRPVPLGTLSSGVLLTNLANLVQPVIRYRLTDKVIWHDEPCRCGLQLPFIELQGREEEILTFENHNRKVPISPTVMMLAALDTEGCNGAQFIQRTPDRLEVRWDVKYGFDRTNVGEKLKQYLQSVFEKNSLCVEVLLSTEPFVRTKGGKYRAVFREC